jgi:hypothetical protein
VLSLLLATTAALAVFVIIRATRPEAPADPPPDPVRKVVYVCPRQHKNLLPLQEQPRACPDCRVSAYPQVTYRCTIHGRFSASLRFEREPGGQLKVSELRLPGREWVKIGQGLTCPQCRLPLQRVPDDPLANRKPD